MRAIASSALLVIAVAAAGCGGGATVPLLSAAGIPITQTLPPDIPLEVVTRSTGVNDPLPVDGSLVTYGDIETALGHAISSAAVPWAAAHREQRPEGWQLFVELTRADASHKGGRFVVSLGVRATLRTRSTRTFLAQTQANCKQGGVVPAEGGAPVIYTCMEQMGRDLAGWLGQIQP